MRVFRGAVVGITASLIICIALVRSSLLARPTHSIPVFPDWIVIGNFPSQTSICSWVPYDSPYEYCYFPEAPSYSIATKNHRVSMIYVFTYYQKLTIGDVILEWGNPMGTQTWGGSGDYVWKDRYAYVMNTGSAFSRVGYVAFGEYPRVFEEWRGFRK